MLDDLASVTLSTALDAVATQQRVTANNISNIETPNYKAVSVSFEDSLRDAVASGDPSQALVTQTASDGPVSANGNNVSLDTETVNAEKETLQYQLLSSAMSAKFNLLDTVIKG